MNRSYKSLDEMVKLDGTPKPEEYGGGIWDAANMFKFYKKQQGDRYNSIEWFMLESYLLNSLRDKDE